MDNLREVSLKFRQIFLRALNREFVNLFEKVDAAYTELLTNIDNPNYEKIAERYEQFLSIFRDELPSFAIAGINPGSRLGEQWLELFSSGTRAVQVFPEVILETFNLTDSRKLNEVFSKFEEFHLRQLQNTLVVAQENGIGPRETARLIRDYFTSSASPLADARRFARTTQIYAAREATRRVYEENGVEFWIWSANIGSPRTCLACIVQHGTIHPVTERLNDHHNGRCSSIPVVKGVNFSLETGVEWLERNPDEMARIIGPRLYPKFVERKASLQDLVGEYESPLFGKMICRKGLD